MVSWRQMHFSIVVVVVVYGASERCGGMSPLESYQVAQIHDGHSRGYSWSLRIQGRQVCHHDRTVEAHAASVLSQIPCHAEWGQLLSVASTNAVRVDDSYPSSQIPAEHPSEPAWTSCSVSMSQAFPYLGGHLGEATKLRQHNHQHNRRFHLQKLFHQKL